MTWKPKPRPCWKTNPELFQTDKEGNFILNKDGTPRLKIGRKVGGAYNYHSDTKAKFKIQRDISTRRNEVKRLETKLNNKKALLEKKVKIINKIEGNLGITKRTSAILSELDLDCLPGDAKKRILDGEVEIAFRPHPGPQTAFLAASEKDVLYGGAAGGGKSYAMLIDPLRYAEEKDHRAIILRRTLGELTELMDKSRELYPLAFPGAKYKEAKKTWEFPSGCKIMFGYLEKDQDVYQYQGIAFSWIGFDELTHLPTSFAWDYLRSRLRTTNPRIKTYMRATTNPGGPGHAWVKKRYIDPAAPNTTFWDDTGNISRKFIPATLQDNPSLFESGEYQAMLESLDPIQRKRLLNGDWNIIEGAAFPEFDTSLHVIPPMEIPPHWDRFKCIDYGYRAPSACLWIATDPNDGTLFVYRELYEKGLTGEQLAIRLHDMEIEERMPIPGILDGASWANHGQTGPSVGEALQRGGHKLRRADKNRIAGKIQVHERLKLNEKSGRPRTLFFSTCSNIIGELTGIPVDPKNKEDVDTTAEDHAYDAFRYGVMSRPRMDDPFIRMMKFKSTVYQPFDPVFGA